MPILRNRRELSKIRLCTSHFLTFTGAGRKRRQVLQCANDLLKLSLLINNQGRRVLFVEDDFKFPDILSRKELNRHSWVLWLIVLGLGRVAPPTQTVAAKIRESTVCPSRTGFQGKINWLERKEGRKGFWAVILIPSPENHSLTNIESNRLRNISIIQRRAFSN